MLTRKNFLKLLHAIFDDPFVITITEGCIPMGRHQFTPTGMIIWKIRPSESTFPG